MKTLSVERHCPFDDCRKKLRSDNATGICGRCQQYGRRLPVVAEVAPATPTLCAYCQLVDGSVGSGHPACVKDGCPCTRCVRPPVPTHSAAPPPRVESPGAAALPHRGLGDGAQRPPALGLQHEVIACTQCPMRDVLMERCQHPESVATTNGRGRDLPSGGANVDVPVWCPLELHGPLTVIVKRAGSTTTPEEGA